MCVRKCDVRKYDVRKCDVCKCDVCKCDMLRLPGARPWLRPMPLSDWWHAAGGGRYRTVVSSTWNFTVSGVTLAVVRLLGVTSEHNSEHASEHMSEHMSEHKSEHKSGHMSEHMSERMSEHISEHISEHNSEHNSEHCVVLWDETLVWLSIVRCSAMTTMLYT
jgi:hypothetical protein